MKPAAASPMFCEPGPVSCQPPADKLPQLSVILALLFFLLLTTGNSFAQLDQIVPPSEQAPAGQALAQKWRDAIPEESAEYHGSLKIRHRDEDVETIPITFKIVTGEPSWQTIYEAKPTAKRPGEKLVIVHTPGKSNEYLFAKGSKSNQPAGEPVRLAPEHTATAFAGSDFWLIDLGLEFFHWPTQRLLRTEMRKSQVAKVLESIDPQPNTGYARVVTWLEKESGAPILAEAYETLDKKLLKQFSIKSVKKVKGQYHLQEMRIRNVKTDSTTWIEYDFDKE